MLSHISYVSKRYDSAGHQARDWGSIRVGTHLFHFLTTIFRYVQVYLWRFTHNVISIENSKCVSMVITKTVVHLEDKFHLIVLA